jgi:hypothetical protein
MGGIEYQRALLAQLRNSELRLQISALHALLEVVRSEVEHVITSTLATNELFSKVTIMWRYMTAESSTAKYLTSI